jgi:hypothetical protein
MFVFYRHYVCKQKFDYNYKISSYWTQTIIFPTSEFYYTFLSTKKITTKWKEMSHLNTNNKILCESKNICEYKNKELYFLCRPNLNNVTVIVNMRHSVVYTY